MRLEQRVRSGLTAREALSVLSLSAIANVPRQDRDISRKTSFSEIRKSLVGVNSEINGENYSGSGIMLTSDGYILTASHVLHGKGDAHVTVTTRNGKKYGITDWYWYNDSTDIALIKIPRKVARPAPVRLRVNHNYRFRSGNPIHLLGYNDGQVIERRGTVTRMYQQSKVENHTWHNLFETTAQCWRGLSGSPIVSDRGELIGIVVYFENRGGAYVAGGTKIWNALHIARQVANEHAARMFH